MLRRYRLVGWFVAAAFCYGRLMAGEPTFAQVPATSESIGPMVWPQVTVDTLHHQWNRVRYNDAPLFRPTVLLVTELGRSVDHGRRGPGRVQMVHRRDRTAPGRQIWNRPRRVPAPRRAGGAGRRFGWRMGSPAAANELLRQEWRVSQLPRNRFDNRFAWLHDCGRVSQRYDDGRDGQLYRPCAQSSRQSSYVLEVRWY